jgi:hypothetical protein
MLVSSIALMFALFTQTLSRAYVDHRERNTFIFISRACLMISLVIAPWSLKCLIVATVLVIPGCLRSDSAELSHCSRNCIARSHCSHPHN